MHTNKILVDYLPVLLLFLLLPHALCGVLGGRILKVSSSVELAAGRCSKVRLHSVNLHREAEVLAFDFHDCLMRTTDDTRTAITILVCSKQASNNTFKYINEFT